MAAPLAPEATEATVQRALDRFRQDPAGDWVAVLACGHCQHMRHAPPFTNREWVTSEAGRGAKLGTLLDCAACARFELPDTFVPYKRTPEFTQDTVPAGLLRDHSTKRGVWARIVVLEGGLRYTVDALEVSFDLSPEASGVVVPDLLHRVAPLGDVRFYVEFFAAP